MSSSPNTALLSLPPLRPSPSKQHSSYSRQPSASSSSISSSASRSAKQTTTKRARSSSIVSVQEVPETYDDQLDQAALTNVNAEWVNYKGAWRPPALLEGLKAVRGRQARRGGA